MNNKPTIKECCEKCGLKDSSIMGCEVCPCHSPKPKETSWEEKIAKFWKEYHYLKGLDRVGYAKLFYEFENLLTQELKDQEEKHEEEMVKFRKQEIEDLEKVRKDQRESIVSKLRGMKRKCDGENGCGYDGSQEDLQVLCGSPPFAHNDVNRSNNILDQAIKEIENE